MTKPANFPQRKVERRERALERLKAFTIYSPKRQHDLAVLAARIVSARNIGARNVRTKKDRSDRARFSRTA